MLSAALLLAPVAAQAQTAVMPNRGTIKMGVGVGGGILAYKAAKACLDHKISCAVAIGGGAALTYGVKKALSPPGDCGPNQFRQLNQAVEDSCKRPPVNRCLRLDSPAVMGEKARRFLACAAARSRRETMCFGGGDKNHKTQINMMQNAYRNCIEMAGL